MKEYQSVSRILCGIYISHLNYWELSAVSIWISFDSRTDSVQSMFSSGGEEKKKKADGYTAWKFLLMRKPVVFYLNTEESFCDVRFLRKSPVSFPSLRLHHIRPIPHKPQQCEAQELGSFSMKHTPGTDTRSL